MLNPNSNQNNLNEKKMTQEEIAALLGQIFDAAEAKRKADAAKKAELDYIRSNFIIGKELIS